MNKWTDARKAVREGQVVFFPRMARTKPFSVLAYERKKGMKFKVVPVSYQECPGMAVWRVG